MPAAAAPSDAMISYGRVWGPPYTPVDESPLYRGIRVGCQAAQLPSCVREVAYDADRHLLPDRFARERFRGEVIRKGQADGHAHAFRRGVVEVRGRTPRDLRPHDGGGRRSSQLRRNDLDWGRRRCRSYMASGTAAAASKLLPAGTCGDPFVHDRGPS